MVGSRIFKLLMVSQSFVVYEVATREGAQLIVDHFMAQA